MQIHQVRGRDLQEALKLARRQYGESALVVNHEALSDGGVTLSVCGLEDVPTEARPRRDQKPGAAKAKSATGKPKGARKPPAKAGTSQAEKGRRASAPKPVHPGLRDVKSHLAKAGASRAFRDRIVEAIDPVRLETEHAIDVAAGIIGSLFEIAKSPRTPGRIRITAFVGPSGGGKTSTLVKLAAKMAAAKRRVVMASLDVKRVGSEERLRSFADHLRLPLLPVHEPEDLRQLFELQRGTEICLCDGSGSLREDSEALQRIVDLDSRLQLDTCLVLPATSSKSVLSETIQAFAPLEPSSCVLTKLDETRKPMPVLELILAAKLPVAFLSNGRDVGTSLHRASADIFSDLALRGRIA